MDLVDIDKMLDDLEKSEQKGSTRSPVVQQARPGTAPAAANRRIKVSSVLSSLHEYVDYDRKTERPGTRNNMNI